MTKKDLNSKNIKKSAALSEALQSSLNSIQEAWGKWDSLEKERDKAGFGLSPKEKLEQDAKPLLQKLKAQIEKLS